MTRPHRKVSISRPQPLRHELSPTQAKLAVVVLLFSTIGVMLLVRSFALAYVAVIEPESGTADSKAVKTNDASASAGQFIKFAAPSSSSAKPPAGGYFSVKPPGSFNTLPNDAAAAAMVTRSTWEPRPENSAANHTVPPSSFTTAGYSGMENHAALFGRVTGNFTGTTDEIIQWAAAKWGWSDEIIRGEAITESYWYQNRKTAAGAPINGSGYGDFGHCGGSPAPSGYGTNGPASFGLMQIKWCAMKDASAAGYDGWPWSETSTAYNLDLYGAIMRGCYEGWDSWLGNGYAAGDVWGCVGRWYAGEWHTPLAEPYITTTKNHVNEKAWLAW